MDEIDLDQQINSSLTINELDLETELAICPSLYHRFSSLALDAELIFQKKELDMQVYEVELAKKIKEQLAKDGMKKDKITESEIKRLFKGDDRWLELKHKVLESESDYKKLEKAAKSFEMKQLSCQSLNKRQLFKASKGMMRTEDL